MPPADDPPGVAPQRIPRPEDAEAGRPAPWHDVPEARRRGLDLGAVEAALSAADRSIATTVPPDPLDELSGVAADVTEGLRDSAVLVALFEEAGEARLVLTRRSDRLRRHRGEVSLPGGRLEPGELPLAAALREAHEEVGIDPSVVRPVAWLRPIVTFASGSLIRPYVAALPERPALTIATDEVERAFDVSLRDLLADGTFHEERWRRPTPRAGADGEATFPIYFFEVEGEVVWGATARILTELCCLASGVAMR